MRGCRSAPKGEDCALKKRLDSGVLRAFFRDPRHKKGLWGSLG